MEWRMYNERAALSSGPFADTLSAPRGCRRAQSGRGGGVGLLREAEVGERVLAVPVEDDPRHLVVADVEEARCVRPHLPEPQAACLATRTEAVEHEDTLAV